MIIYVSFFLDSNLQALMAKIFNNLRLENYCSLGRGEEIGKKANVIRNTKSISCLNFITGSDFSRYSNIQIRSFIDISDVKKDINKFYGKKIIVRQVGKNITATYDYIGCVMPQSIYYIVPLENIQFQYILGLLNSFLFDFIYNVKYNTKEIFPRILLENLKNLPIPNTSIKDQQPIINLVDKILEAKRLDPTADTSALESEIDRMVYALYNLTEEEIKIIEK